METEAAVNALSALAQPTRLEIFRALVRAGPDGLRPGRIGEALGLAPATLSFHLAALSRSGLVAVQRVGRERIYRAEFDAMHGVVDYLTENCCGGASCRPDTTRHTASA